MRIFPGAISVLLLTLIVAIDAVWLTVEHISITILDKGPILVLLAPPACIALIRRFPAQDAARARILRRLDLAMQGLIFISAAWVGSVFVNRLLVTVRRPYVDQTLADWDKMLGFDWLRYFAFVTETPVLRGILGTTYEWFVPASFVAFLVMALCEERRRAAYQVEAYFLSSVVCITLGMFLPAEGATAHFLRGAVPDQVLRQMPGLYHIETLHQLRSERLMVLDPMKLYGLVTFPSFHTAGAIVIATAFWRTRWFWPAALYATALIVATPVYGGHYLIDLVAGAAVAAGVLGGLAALGRYRGVLQLRGPAAPVAGYSGAVDG